MRGNIFIRRPIFAMVIAIMIVVLGLIGIRNTPIEQYPDITPPMVQVSAEYQGADAQTVEESVATPIEEQVNGVSDMIYMESTNSNNGQMTLQVSFRVGSDPNMNTVFTQNRVSAATPLLPSSVITQGVTTQKTMTSYIIVLALASDGRYDETFLSNYAMINLKDRIARINGVGEVQVLGGGAYAMRVWIKPDKMDYFGLTVSEIAGAVTSQSQVVPGGQLGAEPTSEKPDFTYTVRMPSQYNTAEQFGNIIVRANSDGSLVRLRDVATIELGTQSYDVSSTYQGKPGVILIINQSPGSNAVAVGKEVKALLAQMSQEFPDGVSIHTMVDSTATITSGIKDIITTLFMALLLVILVIYIFLQDWRATLVPLIAIPVSLVGAFMLFPLVGFSVNVFSLLGLVLAIGLVVDDAIVVVEAVQVNISKGMEAKAATQQAMRDVSSSIVAMTSVLMAVFLPVGLMPGAAGRLYQQFALTIAITVCLSGINALSLTPALCSVLLKPQTQVIRKGFFGWFNRVFKSSIDDYLKKSTIILHHSGRTLVFIALVTGVCLLLVKKIPSGMLPDEDQGYLMGNIQLPNAASLERTQQVLTHIQKLLATNDNIEGVTAAAGYSMVSGTASPNSGLLFIRLKDYSKRKQTAAQISEELNKVLYEGVNAAQVYTFGPPSIPGLGPSSGFTMMIQDKGGNTPAYLAKYTQQFIKEASKRPEIASISTLYEADVPQKAITINNEKVLKAGVSLNELHNKLSTYLGGLYVNNFNRFGRMYQTYLQAASEYRLTQEDLDMFFVTNNQGQSLPLSAFVSVRDTSGPQFTNRFNLYRSAAVTGLPSSKYSTSQTMQALEETAAKVLPSDMGYAWSNLSYQEANSSGSGMVFLYAVIFIFLILAALYESWSLPMSIILGIPFAVLGAMGFTYLGHLFDTKYIDDIFLQVSLIMLIGLAAKNAILIVEYANAKFHEGLSLKDAAIAGARLRVRPVLMTAFAFLMGVIPLIFATGSNAVARNIMGLALFGGMLIATLIGLFAYPALFFWIGKVAGYEKHRTPPTSSSADAVNPTAESTPAPTPNASPANVSPSASESAVQSAPTESHSSTAQTESHE